MNTLTALHKRLDSSVVLVVSVISGHVVDYLWKTAIQGTTERRLPAPR